MIQAKEGSTATLAVVEHDHSDAKDGKQRRKSVQEQNTVPRILANDPTLTVVDLTFNGTNHQLGFSGMRDLIQALNTSKNTTVTTLLLSGNGIGDRGAKLLAELLTTNLSLTTLDLGANGITYSGFKAILATLRFNYAIQSIKLEDNKVGDDQLKELDSVLGT
jgi:Ran GTPase-activating protein (RanGAP) involved in mRNA processing and transport